MRITDIPVISGRIVTENLFDMLVRLGLHKAPRRTSSDIPREYQDYMAYAAKREADLLQNQAMIPENTPNSRIR